MSDFPEQSNNEELTQPETSEQEVAVANEATDESSLNEQKVALNIEEKTSETELEAESTADPAAHDFSENSEIDPEEVLEDESENEKGDPYGGHSHEALKVILEAAIFASGGILSVSHLRDLFESHERPHGKTIRSVMAELMASYEGKGVQLVEVASGYRFQTDADTAPWVSRLWEEKPQRYSRALMETIALIAYRQPMTRGEIEDVRGVAVSSNIIRTLLEREWVRVVGHRDVPGRPAMYATTRQFLDYFGLKSLDQLPSLSEIRDLEEINPQMEMEGTEVTEESQSDNQSEITFGALIEKIRDGQASGKTGSEYIDEHLDGELAQMDDVNERFEGAMEQARAEHEHPDLALDENEESEASASNNNGEVGEPSDEQNMDVPPQQEGAPVEPEQTNDAEQSPLSEEEQWAMIQEKLAQQQALLDARENDDPREEDENE
ncbi:SMC-Scp complex subunit ScpB [Reinekea forsetii]|nr:SMC-Scp complex subunit ScpB [Reinekea forsetii]